MIFYADKEHEQPTFFQAVFFAFSLFDPLVIILLCHLDTKIFLSGFIYYFRFGLTGFHYRINKFIIYE